MEGGGEALRISAEKSLMRRASTWGWGCTATAQPALQAVEGREVVGGRLGQATQTGWSQGAGISGNALPIGLEGWSQQMCKVDEQPRKISLVPCGCCTVPSKSKV
eukprot:1153391-Pelagomonas_calceolata.AAC.14